MLQDYLIYFGGIYLQSFTIFSLKNETNSTIFDYKVSKEKNPHTSRDFLIPF